MDTLSRCRELLSDKPSGGVCSYALIGGKTFPIVTKKYSAACMGALNYGTDDTRGVRGVVMFSNRKTSDEVYRRYLGYILSEKSPWRDLVTSQPGQDFEEIVNKAYILTSLDFPANYVVNFLTAFRLCEEKPSLGTLLIRLMSDGVSFGTGSTMMTFVSEVSAGGLIRLRSDSWHHAFDHNPAKDTIQRINEGRPLKDKLNQPFSLRTAYTPCNIIWGHGSKNIYSGFHSFVVANSKKKGMKRIFSDPVPTTSSSITYEGLLAYGRAVDSGEIVFG